MADRSPRKFFDASTFVVLAFVLAGAALVYSRGGLDGVWRTLVADTALFLEILPKVLAGCLIGAFIGLLLPREVVTRWVGGDSGFVGLLIATLVGAITPGGPFTIYPLGAAFLAIGAGIGPVVAFVTAWNLLGAYRTMIWEMPFFGADFVTMRVLISLPLPVLSGLFAQAIARYASGKIAPGAPR